MVERTLLVTAPLGLHARAAAKLVRVVSEFASEVQLRRLDSSVSADAKSILGVLMLAASCGTRLHVCAEGVDEEAAVNALDSLFAEGFGEAIPGSSC
ncbi:MAG: HPr family phosphocarrier protein [Acidobacteriota bacterium]|nr:HPr family phosphocarrier protein [Acidobacteriota bacterium]